MEALSLPTITDHLTISNLKSFRFIKPSIGQEVHPLHQHDSAGSPASTILSIRTITLPLETIIPFHRHKKEKYYKFLCGDSLEVLMWRGDRIEKYAMTNGRDLVVPPNTPHAVINTNIDPCKILVVASSQDDDDIEWELATERLIQNLHRKAA